MQPTDDQCPLLGTRYPVFCLFPFSSFLAQDGSQRDGLQLGPGTSITSLCTEFQVPTGPPGVVKMES